MSVPPFGNLEWRARTWLWSLDAVTIIRFLAYVPLLLTPPAAAIAFSTYLKWRGGRSEEAYRHLRTSMLVATLNLVLSAVVLYHGGRYIGSTLQSLHAPFRDFFSPPSEKPPFIEI